MVQLDVPIFVGGAPSTGSSLFGALLARHPDIYRAHETSLFNKSQIYSDHDRVKRLLPSWLKTGLPTDGYGLYPRILPHAERDLLKPAILCRCANESATTREFLDSIQMYCLSNSRRRIFAEKTPSNAYCFRQLLSLYPKCVIVHPIRDGRDVVCSLMRRGFDIFCATSYWLYNTACAIACRGMANYFEYKYEQLVDESVPTLKRFCERAGISFHERMLEPQAAERRPRLANVWKSSTTDLVNPNSVGRFRTEMSEEDYARFCSVTLTSAGASRTGTKPYTALDLLRLLGYSARSPSAPPLRAGASAKLLEGRDFMRRNKVLIRKGFTPRRALTKVSL